ncbi:MAG: tetratricopeptide repeat protein [Verrucomicrobiota bacterium]
MKPKQKQAAVPRAEAARPVPQALKNLSARRKWSFRVAALVGVPALLFAIVELALCLIGYGYSSSFFISNPVAGQNTLVENRQFSRRYFSKELMRPPRPLVFAPAKPRQTMRIFIFGESAAEGDPAPAFGFARILQVLLRDRYPDQNIEVINTAVTAINSHVIRPIARECADYSADVWVIYMGNNEVVGPFGSGTVFGAQTPSLPVIRAGIALKATRTGQLLDSALESRGQRGPRAWAGMEMFLKQQVRESDPRMATVYSHFESNLSDIIAYGVRSGAKVVVSTVGSNLRDCAPLASLHRTDLSPSDSAAWERLYQAGVALENEGKFTEAVGQYEKAAQLDGQFADLQFHLARCNLALNRPDEARRHFLLARDLDTLRFRADSHLNEIIRRLAGQWQGRGVRLADAEAALARESADGTPGAEWFYEHVHLTFPGNYLVARQMAEQVIQCIPNTNSGQVKVNDGSFLSLAECARRLGLTDWEQLQMAEEMQRRTSRPPFTNQLDHAADAERRKKAVSDLRNRDQTNFPSAVVIYEQALALADADWQLHDRFAGALLEHGDKTNAVEHWQKVVQLLPHRIQTYDLLGSALLEQARLNEAEVCYRPALTLDPDLVICCHRLGQVCLAQNRGEEALSELLRGVPTAQVGRTHNHLGLALLQLGKATEAEAAFRSAFLAEPDFVPARLNLGSALLAQGKIEEAIAGYQELIRTDPGNVPAHLALAKALGKQGRMIEATQHNQEAVRQQPEDFDARYALGSILIRQQRFAEAAEQFATAVRLRPTSFESRLNYGTILAGQGKTVEARAQFEEALRLNPNFVPAHLNLAIALAQQNQFDDAMSHLREVLRIEPGNAAARRLIQSLPTQTARP